MRTVFIIFLCVMVITQSAYYVVAESPRTKHKPVVIRSVKIEESKTSEKLKEFKWLWIGLGALAAGGLVALVAGGGGGNGDDPNGNVTVNAPALPSN